jgi:hypothetical protein
MQTGTESAVLMCCRQNLIRCRNQVSVRQYVLVRFFEKADENDDPGWSSFFRSLYESLQAFKPCRYIYSHASKQYRCLYEALHPFGSFLHLTVAATRSAAVGNSTTDRRPTTSKYPKTDSSMFEGSFVTIHVGRGDDPSVGKDGNGSTCSLRMTVQN